MTAEWEDDDIWISGAKNARAIADGNLRDVLADRLDEVLAQSNRTLRSLGDVGTGRPAVDGNVIYPVTFIAAARRPDSAK